MTQQRWWINRDVYPRSSQPHRLMDGELRWTALSTEQADSLELQLNQQTMTGGQIADALEAGKTVEVLTEAGWTKAGNMMKCAPIWQTRSVASLVARVVEPPQPETVQVPLAEAIGRFHPSQTTHPITSYHGNAKGDRWVLAEWGRISMDRFDADPDGMVEVLKADQS